jgi:signal transduction histidine kinase/ligand-binding sensor domain-containing protein
MLFIVMMMLPAGIYLKAVAQQVNIRSYTIENGLVNNDILNIYEDSRGFIWLCTRGGLSRYDGCRFTIFTTDNGLVNDMINDIIETGPQEFIVAQNSGGPVVLKNDRVSLISPASNITLNNFFHADDGRLLAATDDNGIVELRKEGIRPLNSNYRSSTIKISKLNDSLWLAIDLGLAAQLITPSIEARSKLFAAGATTTYVDSRRRAWIGTIKGLKLLDPAVEKGGEPAFLPLPPPFDLPMLRQSFISDILEDSQGNFWFATINGLVHINKNGEVIIYTQQLGLPTSFVNCVREDSRHNIWVGTSMGLAKLLLKKEVMVFTPDSGYGNPGMLAVLPFSKNKARFFDGKSVGLLDLITGRSSDRVLVDSVGYPLYRVGSDEFLLRKGGNATIYRARSEKTETLAWPRRDFTSIVRISHHWFIGCNVDTLVTIRYGRSAFRLTTGIKSPVFTMASTGKTVWGGTFQGGMVKMSVIEKQDSLHISIVDTFAKRLPDQHIRILFTDKENEVWIGTRYKGLLRLLESADGKYELQHYGINDGLSSDFVLAIKRDVYGNMWIGTAQGLDKLIPEGNGYRIFNFGRVNKLFQRIGAIDFADSNHLIGTGYPSVVYARDMNQDAITSFPVYITRVSGAPADTALYNDSARLPHGKAQIYFEFSSPQLINEDFGKYSYRLVGSNDPAWNMAGSSRSVYFANLRPGKYTFQVRTLGFNGAWGMPATYDFLVEAPFWQKTWFILLVVFAIGLLAYAAYRYRVQQLIQLQRVRNRIATDLHDEIGSNLTNISILSNLSKTNLLQPQKAGDFLQRISEEVSSSSQALDDIIWSVNTNHDTLEETVARMRRYAAELFDSANISYELYLDPAFEGKRLSMEQRRDLYLLYKEAVNNISKHADAQHVIIQIAIEHNQLLLSVKDDGKGFDAEKESNRYGLKSMKLRVKKWKGKISIDSGIGQGTFMQVRLPVSR